MDSQKKRKGLKRSFTESSSSSSSSTVTPSTGSNQPTEAEISLAKRLVHTDKEVRDAAFSAVSTWLMNQVDVYNSNSSKDNKDTSLTTLPDTNDPLYIEMMKMWKALYYCVWMSDKPVIQNELVTNVAQLVQSLPLHTVGGQLYSLLFIKGCMDTLYREWLGLDRYRVDKYLLLIRRIFNSSFTFIGKLYQLQPSTKPSSKSPKTNKDTPPPDTILPAITLLTNLYTQYLFQPPNGIRLHIVDIYVDEIVAALPTISNDLFQFLMIPIYKALESVDDKTVFQRIVESIFNEQLFSSTASTQLSSAANTTENDDNDVADSIVQYHPPLTNINYAILAQQLFRIGANPLTRGGYRDNVYALHKLCVKVAKALGHVEKTSEIYASTKNKTSTSTTSTTGSSNGNIATTTTTLSSASKGKKTKDHNITNDVSSSMNEGSSSTNTTNKRPKRITEETVPPPKSTTTSGKVKNHRK